MPIAYLDLPSGLSGDIFLGCLVAAGWPVARLEAVIGGLGLPAGSWSVRVEGVMRGPMAATLLHVEVAEGGHHRHLNDIRQIIQTAHLPQPVQERAIRVFTRLARAEAQVHGMDVESVHFHEVGALDAIVDIVGVTAGLHEMGIHQLYASGAPLGEGWTRSAHGPIPVPAPATLVLLTEAGATTRPAPGPGELVTPTGAALLAEFAHFAQPAMRLQTLGVGAGQKEFAWPNVARLWLGEPADNSPLVELETNIDDMNPELYGPVQEALFAAGALDVWITPIQMKKGRPAILLSVLARSELEEDLATLLLRQTTTLGVRVHGVHRHMADRSFTSVETPYGSVGVKLKLLDGLVVGAKPEFEDCYQLAKKAGIPVHTVQEMAQSLLHEKKQ